MPLVAVSSLCPARREVLTAPEAETHNHGACPSVRLIVVLNETVAKLVSEAARSGLLALFQHLACNIAVCVLGPEDQQRCIEQRAPLRCAHQDAPEARSLVGIFKE
eukprot:5418947-Alexandrium_andersonii.AAC.1